MAYLIDRQTGRVHIHRRFTEPDESEAWCGLVIRPIVMADFVKGPRQGEAQCLRCQDRKYEEGKRGR